MLDLGRLREQYKRLWSRMKSRLEAKFTLVRDIIHEGRRQGLLTLYQSRPLRISADTRSSFTRSTAKSRCC